MRVQNTFLPKTVISAALGFSIVCAMPVSANSPSTGKIAELSPVQAEMKRRADAMPIWHKMLMPGEIYNLNIAPEFFARIDGQPFNEESWTAPMEAGNHKLEVINRANQVIRTVTIFVLEPSTSIDKRGYIGKYRIGFYPKDTPKGFIKLEKGEGALPVSPHFKVGQFLCKQQPGTWPKYVLVSGDNLVRLETLLEDLNEKRDTEAETLFVMSGFRTPFYNTAIGSAKFSRHMYGDAADVYVDTKPRDGVMDDINRDGVVNKSDANFMYDYAQKLYKAEGLKQGGIGSYKANAVHGPFVHIDARGRAARWGR